MSDTKIVSGNRINPPGPISRKECARCHGLFDAEAFYDANEWGVRAAVCVGCMRRELINAEP